MDINELLKEGIKTLNKIEEEIVTFIFSELENDQYSNQVSLEEKTLEKIDQKGSVKSSMKT